MSYRLTPMMMSYTPPAACGEKPCIRNYTYVSHVSDRALDRLLSAALESVGIIDYIGHDAIGNVYTTVDGSPPCDFYYKDDVVQEFLISKYQIDTCFIADLGMTDYCLATISLTSDSRVVFANGLDKAEAVARAVVVLLTPENQVHTLEEYEK